MKKAANEAVKLALEREDYAEHENKEGELEKVPFTTVQLDGSYMTRSYTYSKYDSPAGCVVIIEHYTKKVIQIKTRQKTCATCDYARSHGVDPKTHECVRNHGLHASTTSMESAATAEAFKDSITDTGLIYRTMISDGDASNCFAVDNALPYAIYGLKVQHILCKNHICRNVSTALKITSDKKGNHGKKIRDVIKNSGESAVAAIHQAILSIKTAENLSWFKKIRALQINIRTLPYHIFGGHSQCSSSSGCKIPKKSEVNYVPEMVEKNLFDDVIRSFCRAESNVESLLHDQTTSACESFNALIVKCIGYKGVNYAKKEGYKCHVAVLQHNEQETLAPICNFMEKDVPSLGQKIQSKRAELVMNKHSRKKQVADLSIPANESLELQEEQNHETPSEDIQSDEDISSTLPLHSTHDDEMSSRSIKPQSFIKPKKISIPTFSTDKDYGPHAWQPDATEENYKFRVQEHMN
ncbi:hypothetical protein TKK_0002207 [Trichogramma kaykai]